jgi:hypothetical protein
MPFLELTTAPDPDDVGRLKRIWEVDTTRFPDAAAGAACGKQEECES